MSPYEFVFKLHDLFTSPLARIANNYERVTGGMQRRAQAVSRVFAPMGAALRRSFTAPQGSVAELTQQIENLKAKARNIDIRVNRRGLVETNREIQRMERRIEKLQGYGVKQRGSGGGGMGMLMAGGMVAGLAYGAYNTAEAAIGKTVAPAMQREKEQFMLSSFLKSKERGASLTGEMAKFAKDNPLLGADEVFSSGRRLLASGFTQKEVIPELKMLGDLSAGSGTSIDALTYLYKQVKQNGFAQAQELGPLSDYIPIYQELSKLLGKSIGDVKKLQEDGKITFGMVQKSLQNLTSGKGLYANISEQMGTQTSYGRFRQIQGEFQEKLTELGLKVLPTVNSALDWILKNAERLAPLQEPLSGLMTVLGNGFGVVKSLFQAFGILNKEGDLAKGFVENLTTAINVLSDALGVLFNVLQGIIQFVQRPIFGYDEKQMAEDERIRRRIKKEHFAREVIQRRQGRNQDIKDEVSAAKKTKDGSSDSNSIGKAAGLEASVSGAKSSVININFKSFIERNEINVENFHEGIDNLEQKFMEMFTRLLASGASIPD